MGQEDVLMILMSDHRFWSTRELSAALGVHENSINHSLKALSNMTCIIVKYEPTGAGLRRLYKYKEAEE